MRNSLKKLINEKVVILDGSTGTMLQKHGMPAGVSPEQFCLDHSQVIKDIQSAYLDAGSDVVYSPTFGANRIKLKNFNLEEQTASMNEQLAKLSASVAHPRKKIVAGSIGPTGVFFSPFGEVDFEEGISIYQEQIKGLIAGGVDLLVIETQLDIQEARIALIAAKECCDLPVLVSMTFDETGRTLTGSDPLTCLTILQSLGVDGFGLNCSTGPDKMLPIIKSIKPYAHIPLMVKPNAGLPLIVKGQTVFPMNPEEFSAYAKSFYDSGAAIMGGCCGTTPEHIQQLADQLQGLPPQAVVVDQQALLVASPRKTVALSPTASQPIHVIGERINPTGKPAFQEALRNNKVELIKSLAQEQAEAGASILDVNVGLAGIDEKAAMLRAVSELAVLSDLPLCIDSSDPEVLAAALRFYPGRALLNSLSGESKKLKEVIPIIKKYGPGFITLPLNDQGIPGTVAERREILGTIFEHCDHAGVAKQDAVIDGLVLTVSSDQQHAQTTLETIRLVAKEFGLNTVLGLSNVSFGLPARHFLNNQFLAMAANEGLSLVIANPSSQALMDTIASCNVLTGRDHGCVAYIERFANSQSSQKTKSIAPLSPEEMITTAVINGEKETIIDKIQSVLDSGKEAFEIVDQLMVPAIQLVGEKYNKREYFLPQLISSAETMEKGVAFLTPLMQQKKQVKKGLGVMATVKGDIHDIGKKIVALMLRNNGYEIIDLGKSVDEETIVNKAIELKADFIGLSALMTTTITEMPKVIQLARAKGLKVKILIGGAVVTANYADEIEADAYAVDAGQAVDSVNQLLQKK